MEFKLQKNCEINSAHQNVLGPVEMMFGLVNVSFSCKNDFLCTLDFEGLCTRRNVREPKELWRYTPPENFLVYGLRNAISCVFRRHFQEISTKEKR